MRDIIKGKFDYENDSTASYIVLSMSCNEDIVQYQTEMITNNSCSGILSLDVRYNNNEFKIYYNITSKLPLSEFLQRKKLSKNEFIDIVKGIIKPLIDSKEFLLYDKSFLINEDYIFINPSTLDIGMIYVPLDIKTNINEDFKSFLVNLIISLARIDEHTVDNYMQRILNYLKNDIFNISDFNKLLTELRNDENEMNITSKSNLVKKKNKSELIVENTLANRNKDIYLKSKHEEKSKRNPILYEDANKFKNLVMAGLVQVLIILVLAFSLDTIKSFAGDGISTYVGMVLIIAAIDILLFKKLLRNKNTQEIKEKQNINMSKREMHNVDDSINIEKEYKQVAMDVEQINVPFENINETSILKEEKDEFPCLHRMNDGVMHKVSITKEIFIIGRLTNYVDYLIESNTVGRTHCEILFKNGQYFVKDLNSKNGTFINGTRIDSNKEFKINNNDKIKFADIEYIFAF